MYANKEPWSEFRRRVLTGGLRNRQACDRYRIHHKMLAKILTDEEPPGYASMAGGSGTTSKDPAVADEPAVPTSS